MKRQTIFILVLLIIIFSDLFAQEKGQRFNNHRRFNDSTRTTLLTSQIITVLDFKNTDIKDIMRALAEKYDINIFVQDAIDKRITVHLTNISVDQAIQFMVDQCQLLLEQEGTIYKLKLPEPEPDPPPPPLRIFMENGLLTVDVNNEPLDRVIRLIAEKSGKNIVLANGVSGYISGFLQSIELEEGIRSLATINGFSLRKQESLYVIDWGILQDTQKSGQRTGRFWVNAKDSLLSIDFVGVQLADAVREISNHLGIDIIIYGEIKGMITAKCSDHPIEEVLNLLFKGTNYTFRKKGRIFLVGEKTVQGISSTELIQLKHMKVEGLTEILPKRLTSEAGVQIIKEHNGIMVTGSQEIISEARDYLNQIDKPIPQILIEAIVVDFNTADLREFSLDAGLGSPDSSKVSSFRQLFPFVEQTADGDYLNAQIDLYTPRWGLPQVGRLPSDFYLRIKALEQESKAKIRSRPQIATLSGHTASISIGTTQYFILETNTPYPATNNIYVQGSQRFETIKAEMLLEVTPWVSASGEITTEIHPEFSTPKEHLDPNVPPTIDHRILNSTVRLRDGETIILGGLIQDMDSKSYEKFPILGDIPLLGYLFRNHSKNNTSSELMVYLTPHLYYEDLGDVDIEEKLK